MNTVLGKLSEDYRAALDSFLAEGGESALARAYELGRTALNEDVGLLELLDVHHEAVTSLLAGQLAPAEAERRLRAAREFIVEVISPYEMTHRGYRDANTLLHRMNERLEGEAKRIAHVIHDDTGVLLVSVHLALKELESDLSPPGVARLANVRGHLIELEDHLRQLSHELRPTILDDLGLVPALRFLAQGISVRAGLKVQVIDHMHRWLPPAVQTAVYRIVQEAFANIVRHARASRAVVQITGEKDRLHCSIQDDGIGMKAQGKRGTRGPSRGLGLLGIRDRLDALGGTLRIHSNPGEGTELHISIPLEA